MFTLEAPKGVKIQRKLILQYQEQQDDLDVVFKCSNGQEQRCSRLVLNSISEFFTGQLEARERLNNPTEFNYDFSKECVKAFLDYMHGIKIEGVSLAMLLEMMKFIKLEGKDSSDFENDLLNLLCKKLKQAEIPIDVKLMVCVVCKSFDDFRPNLERVRTN